MMKHAMTLITNTSPFTQKSMGKGNGGNCGEATPNCRFNADKNAPHFCRLTWALGVSETHMHTNKKASLFSKVAIIVIACASICACAQQTWPQGYYLDANTGDRIASELKIGMTPEEIQNVVSSSSSKRYVVAGRPRSISSDAELYNLYGYERYPTNVLKDVVVGTEYTPYGYWITPNSYVALNLFFDSLGRLRGWANYPSKLSLEKYWHESLTSKLRVKTEVRGMTHAQVHTAIGEPTEIISLPTARSRTWAEDHFWQSQSIELPPINDIVKRLEVYTYPLDNGTQRRVYLGYYEKSDELVLWGYDHAHEEGERYRLNHAAVRQ
jgi:hypothetical protein